MSPTYCKQVGHWRVSKTVIGSGTTSTVHLASHSTIPTLRAAVKIVSRTGLLLKADGDPTALHLADAVIHREVLLMKLASNKRIIKLYDFVRHGDFAYMILEHAPNKTLFELFRSYPSFLPTSLVTHLFSQLMHAIAHLHSLHIVHRDIKLENVFLFGPDVKDILKPDSIQAHNDKYKHLLHNIKHTPAHTRNVPPPSYTELTLKLGDFGLSHTHSPAELSRVFHGSPHYQAPELWARVPHRVFPTDVWSAGVVLFALVGRRLPFDVRELEEWGSIFNGDNNDELHVDNNHVPAHEKDMEKERANSPIPCVGSPSHMPFDALGMIPSAIDHLLQRLFALDPAMRPTAREVLADTLFNPTESASSHGDVSVSQDSKDHASGHPAPPQHAHADMHDPHDLYDLATLCTPPSTHVPRATFRESSLERRVQMRLESGECIERVWAARLRGWVAWEGEEGMGGDEKEKRVLGKERKEVKGDGAVKERRLECGEEKGWRRSLGRIRGADVRGHLASLGRLGHAARGERAIVQPEPGGHEKTKLSVLKPKAGASLSFRSLRIKTVHKPCEAKHFRPAEDTPAPLASIAASHNDTTSSLQVLPSSLKPKLSLRSLLINTSSPRDTHPTVQISHTPSPSTLKSPLAPTLAFRHDGVKILSRHEAASALQSRHDALLRRAYELGFGTQDLRAFANEAGRIVRDAREGTKGGNPDKVDGEAVISPTDESSSTATTLVPQNGGVKQKSSASADMPVVNFVAVEVGHPRRGLNVDVDVGVDVTFDVDFETDLRWL